MKKLHLITILFSLILALFTPNHVSAQGTYNCGWNVSINQCSFSTSNCETGYVVGLSPCLGLAEDACETGNPYTCVVNPANPPNTFQCNWNSSTGKCMVQTRNCDSGFTWDHNVCLALSEGQCTTLPPQPCIVGAAPPPVTSDSIQIFCDAYSPTSGIRTALGCINASVPKVFIGQILSWAVRVASGILFIMVTYSGFLMITAAGDQKQATRAKQVLSASITGFAIIALSILILNLLGVSIFNLDIFGFRV